MGTWRPGWYGSRPRPGGHASPGTTGATHAMIRVCALALMLALASGGLAGCYYVVPAPPPPPGAPLVVPDFVRERPQCGWRYGTGWYGWAWYGALPC